MKKILPLIFSLTAALAVLLATTAAYASPPWMAYQPEAPKSLIK
jgi:cyclic lactone autoinducer peptide